MTLYFPELRYPQVQAAAEAGAVLVLPIGQTEEHGPHMPINCDTLICQRLCEEAVKSLNGTPPAYWMDPIVYGYSQKVLKKWPGTFVIPQETVIEVLRHIVMSVADMGFKKIVLASFHGNHDGIVRVVARHAADDRGIGPGVVFPMALAMDELKKHWKAGPGGTCHACEMETSVLLHLAPHLVDMSVAVSGDALKTVSPYSSSQAFVSTWTVQNSQTGIYGDPTVATAVLGKILFDKMVAETARFIRYYHGVNQV